MKQLHFIIWCLIFSLPTSIVILYPAAYVFFIDPLWQWNHPFHIMAWHPPFNERIQKTNYLASRKPKIDTLIVGSSRSSFIDPAELGSQYAFNYAVSSGTASEFADHIKYTRKRSAIPLKLIIIESSFNHALKCKRTFNAPLFYIDNAENFTKKINNIFSKDAYELAKKTNAFPSYTYYLISGANFRSYRYGQRDGFTPHQKEQEITYQVSSYRENVYNKEFDPLFPRYISEIHDAVGSANYIVYATPVSKYLLKLMVEMKQLDNYERWIRDLVNEFGVVYNFMYPNMITMNDDSFNDAHHPTSDTASFLIRIMTNRAGTRDLEYVAVIDKTNFDYLLPIIRKCFEEL